MHASQQTFGPSCFDRALALKMDGSKAGARREHRIVSPLSRMTKELRQTYPCDFLVFYAKSSFRIFLMSMSIYKLNPNTLFGMSTLLRHKRLHR